MKTTGRVNGIISNIVIVKADGPVGQNEICYVWTGDTKMMAEVIKVIGDAAYVQVFDSTRGLKIGDKVEFDGKGNWTELKCKYSQVPVRLIPQAIKKICERELSVCKGHRDGERPQRV